MALLKLSDGTILRDPQAIASTLESLHIDFKHYDPGTSLLFPDLDQQDVVDDLAKCDILELHDSQFEYLRRDQGYLFYDMLNVHPGSPQLATLIETYSHCHTHTEPEAIYVLAGEAIYGFKDLAQAEIQLLIQAQDYLHIPAAVEHWFSFSASLSLKAVRYFSGVSGWTPQYSQTNQQNWNKFQE
jgi:1,2-dihydroxy-3-keto-5-methylthiopentene dioxygenase